MTDETTGAAAAAAPSAEKTAAKDFYYLFQTNERLEKEGIWIEYGPFKFLVARAGGHNKHYNKVSEAVMRPFRRQIQLDVLPPEKADELMATIFARAVVKDWKDVTDREGKFIPHSEKNVIQFLLALPDLFAALRDDATKPNLYRQEQIEGDVGN